MLKRWIRATFDLVAGLLTGPEFHHAGTIADIGDSDSRGSSTASTLENETANLVYDGGPRDGEPDTVDALPVVIGTGADGGVYQRTESERGGLTVYRWQPLTDAEANALVRGDLRANQGPD